MTCPLQEKAQMLPKRHLDTAKLQGLSLEPPCRAATSPPSAGLLEPVPPSRGMPPHVLAGSFLPGPGPRVGAGLVFKCQPSISKAIGYWSSEVHGSFGLPFIACHNHLPPGHHRNLLTTHGTRAVCKSNTPS